MQPTPEPPPTPEHDRSRGPSPGAAPAARALRIALLGVLVNAMLAAVKLAAGLVGNSYALVADALESLTDVAASVITSAGVRYAARPPDEDHPYGHGRAESLAGLTVSAMLFGAGVVIAVQAIGQIRDPGVGPAPFTLWVLIGVVVVKESVFRLMRRVARETLSTAVAVDAWHNRADAITSAAAAVGISIALVGGEGYEAADDWAALVAAMVVLYNAFTLFLEPLHELMDRQSPELLARVRAAAERVPGVVDVEKLYARKTGSHYHVDMHLHVDPLMTVHDAHELSGRVKGAVRRDVRNIADVLIHIEPAGEGGAGEEGTRGPGPTGAE